jgi:pimeloyl-ACP methyl ester carboxylesterase
MTARLDYRNRIVPKSPRSAATVVAFVLLAQFSVAAAQAAVTIENSSFSIPRIDGSELTISVARPPDAEKVPIVLAIGGSLCIPTMASDQVERLLPTASAATPYALVIVETPAPTNPPRAADGSIEIGPDFRCSDEFKQRYSIDERVMDHLRAIQHLRRRAPWWNGQLFVWGFSDGGRIGARVAAYTPETARVVLGGFGGGVPMAREFEDFHMCNPAHTADRAPCLAEVRARFEEMRADPTSARTWNGDANTYKAWASRIDSVEANVLHDLAAPLLLMHGTEDHSVPVGSARALAALLSTADGPPFQYLEIAGMSHGLGAGLPEGQSEDLQAKVLQWLLLGTPVQLQP